MSTNKYIILLLSIFSIPVLGFGDELQWSENDHTKKIIVKKLLLISIFIFTFVKTNINDGF